MTWFKTGKQIKSGDGFIDHTVEARSDFEYKEFIDNGWIPLDDKPEKGKVVEGVASTVISIDWLNIKTKDVTKSLMLEKCEELGLDYSAKDKESVILKAIKQKLQGVK